MHRSLWLVIAFCGLSLAVHVRPSVATPTKQSKSTGIYVLQREAGNGLVVLLRAHTAIAVEVRKDTDASRVQVVLETDKNTLQAVARFVQVLNGTIVKRDQDQDELVRQVLQFHHKLSK